MSHLIFEHLDKQDYELHYFSKIDLYIEFFLTLIGNGLSLVVINYEQFGGDPMKRGIENKFISSLAITQIVGTFLSALTLFLRALVGPLNLVLTQAVWFILVSLNHFASLVLILIYSYKDLNILAFHFASHLDEGFWFIFSQIQTLSMSIMFTFIMYFLNHGSFALVSAYAGLPIPPRASSNLTFVLVGLGAVLMFLSHFIITLYKVIKHESQVDQPSVHMFNNLVHNPNVLSDLQLLGSATFFVISGFIPILVYEGKAPETADEVFLYWLVEAKNKSSDWI